VCTLAAVFDGKSQTLVVGFNRDEKRSRAPETAIAHLMQKETKIIAPQDSEAGGTWIGVNETGLVFCLLNINSSDTLSLGAQSISRGAIIPSIWQAKSIGEARDLMKAHENNHGKSYRLLVFSGLCQKTSDHSNKIFIPQWCEWIHESRKPMEIKEGVLTDIPLLRASSSAACGDAAAQDFRQMQLTQIFDRTQKTEGDFNLGDIVFEFMHLTIPNQEVLSPLMSRSDAATTSVSLISVKPSAVTFFYEHVANGICKELVMAK
jgi:hypothetical protein